MPYDHPVQGAGDLNGDGCSPSRRRCTRYAGWRELAGDAVSRPAPTIAGVNIAWAQSILWGNNFLWGDTVYRHTRRGPTASSGATTCPLGQQHPVSGTTCSGATASCGATASSWGNSILWGNGIVGGNSILWGNSILYLWGNSILWGNSVLWGTRGRNTSRRRRPGRTTGVRERDNAAVDDPRSVRT